MIHWAMGRVSDTLHMFTPERTALVVLGASLVFLAVAVMCSRSSVVEPIPMAPDSVVVVTRIDTVSAKKHEKPRKTTSASHKPPKEKKKLPTRDPWNEIVPNN